MPAPINNRFYDELGDRWWNDESHPIAILRVEGKLKCQYVIEGIRRQFGSQSPVKVLDVACGAGFLSLPLADAGFDVRGVDFSKGSIEAAQRKAAGKSRISFAVGDATKLAEADHSYDVVLLMDCLEHFEQPHLAVREAARVVKPGGLVFIHTFNRTFLSRILAVKAIEWLTKDAPEHIHIYEMFITPDELRKMCQEAGLLEVSMTGIQPDFAQVGFWRTILARKLMPGFAFRFCRSTAVGYMGTFRRN